MSNLTLQELRESPEDLYYLGECPFRGTPPSERICRLQYYRVGDLLGIDGVESLDDLETLDDAKSVQPVYIAELKILPLTTDKVVVRVPDESDVWGDWK